MTDLEWHGEQRGFPELSLFDRNPGADKIDLQSVRAYRLARVRQAMAEREIAACILSDSVNIRYATGTRNMQVFTGRNQPSRYLLLTESDMEAFDEFYKRLIGTAALNDVTSRFSMETIKDTTALPI